MICEVPKGKAAGDISASVNCLSNSRERGPITPSTAMLEDTSTAVARASAGILRCSQEKSRVCVAAAVTTK